MKTPSIIAAAALLGLSSAVSATTLFPQAFVCPVGGERFTANVIGSMSSWGQRPDGRRYGTTPIVPLTECPKNGFVFFDEKFSVAEKAKLSSLVPGKEYQALRNAEAPHYRAWWLMDRLGRNPYDKAFMLLVASWEADGDPARKTRYQQMFVDAVRKLELSASKREDWFWMNVRAANALRELSRFDESSKLLATLDAPERLPEGGRRS